MITQMWKKKQKSTCKLNLKNNDLTKIHSLLEVLIESTNSIENLLFKLFTIGAS